MIKVLVAGQTPPPYGGQAVIIEQFVRSKLADVQLIHVRMGFSSDMKEVGRVRFSKITSLISLICRIYYCRIVHGTRIFHYPPGGPDKVPMYRDIAILLATRWLFDKTILHFHAGGVSELYPQLPRWQQWLFRRAFYGADAAIRISDLNPPDGERMKAKRDYVVPYGIQDCCPAGILPRAVVETSAERPLKILFVGIICESKGIWVLLDACQRLAARGIPFVLEIMGQPHDEQFLARTKELIVEKNLQEHVRFLGVLTGRDKWDAYARADVFCMPTFFNCETFGLVFAEAMCMGLPTVGTQWRGVPSVVADGETGFLVEIKDPEAVADRLAQLAADGALRVRMGQAGRAKFEREFILQRDLERMREVLLEVAGEMPGTSAARQPALSETSAALPPMPHRRVETRETIA